MTLDSVRKRNNEIVPFDRARIEHAIEQACVSIGHQDTSFIPELTTEVILDLQERFDNTDENNIPTIENIQDTVERRLILADLFEIAKAYILYRAKQIEKRKEQTEEKVAQHELKILKRDGSVDIF